MPKRNALRQYGAGEYYHVYNRGAGKMEIFRDDEDYLFLLALFKKYLGHERRSNDGHAAPNYREQIELIAYCLMPNHYHMMVYLKENDGLEKLMRSTMTAYSMYFNRKYKRSGTLFEGRFLASRITHDTYYWQVSRYIHWNPLDIGKDYLIYPYSSVNYYIGNWQAPWVHPEHVVADENEKERYRKELAGSADWHKECHKLKHMLAGHNQKL